MLQGGESAWIISRHKIRLASDIAAVEVIARLVTRKRYSNLIRNSPEPMLQEALSRFSYHCSRAVQSRFVQAVLAVLYLFATNAMAPARPEIRRTVCVLTLV